jgi:hypothetical protein
MRPGWPAPVQPGKRAQPSRKGDDTGPVEIEEAGPTGIEEADPAGTSRAGPAEAAGVPMAQPAWGSTDPAGMGQEEPTLAQNKDVLASKARIAIFWPTGAYSSWKAYMPAGRVICRPGECRSHPQTHICRLGHKICWPDEIECRPGDNNADPGQPYASPGELMSAREAEEDLQHSEVMLMSSPRADNEDPVQMYSYQCLDQPHGGRQMSSW